MLPGLLDDETLLAQALMGDGKAFSTLWRKHEKLLLATAIRFADDAQDAEDLVQDAFITAWAELDKLKCPSKVKSWFAGIVRNKSRSSRAYQRRHSPKANEAIEGLESVAANTPSPLEHIESRRSWDDLEKALDQLAPKFREPLLLYFLLDQNYSDVSLVLGVKEATVRKRISRAREKLRTSNDSLARFQSCAKKSASAATVIALLTPRKSVWAKVGSALWSVNGGLALSLGAAAITLCMVTTSSSASAKLHQPVAHQHKTPLSLLPATVESPKEQFVPDEAESSVLPVSTEHREVIAEYPLPPQKGHVTLGRGKAKKETGTPKRETRISKASSNAPKTVNDRVASTLAHLETKNNERGATQSVTPKKGVVKTHGPAQVTQETQPVGPSVSLETYQSEYF